jgi:hypothetical protein
VTVRRRLRLYIRPLLRSGDPGLEGLQIAGRTRGLAMFNLAIDSRLRGCDVVSLRVEDVAPHGHAVDRATVRQKRTGQPVKCEMTDPRGGRQLHRKRQKEVG